MLFRADRVTSTTQYDETTQLRDSNDAPAHSSGVITDKSKYFGKAQLTGMRDKRHELVTTRSLSVHNWPRLDFLMEIGG